MKKHKVKECVNRICRIFGISIRKATSYKVVKGRLSYRFYNDDFLKDYTDYTDQLNKED